MPRRIATYTASDWLRLRPLSQRYKTWLWDRLDRRYASGPADDPQALQALLGRLSGKNVVASIAFNAPWTIGWQLRFVGRNLENAAFLVADNSSDPHARAAIAGLCAEAGVAYFQLPESRYQGRRYASRSHGLALNWTYRNVIRALGPMAWGFFDHDLFPTRPFDPETRLRGQPFYGALEQRPGGDVGRGIARAVIEDEKFEIAKALPANAGDRRVERGLAVANRQQHGQRDHARLRGFIAPPPRMARDGRRA